LQFNIYKLILFSINYNKLFTISKMIAYIYFYLQIFI